MKGEVGVEVVYEELKGVEVYRKGIEEGRWKKVEIEGERVESGEKWVKKVLGEFEGEGKRMKRGGYVDKGVWL